MAEEKTILLTQEAYDKMKEELAWREGEYRDEILSKVSAARALSLIHISEPTRRS